MEEAEGEIVCRSIKDFDIDFHKNVAGEIQGNFVSSALSAHVVLTMAACGAEGETRRQMLRALHLAESEAPAFLGFKSFIGTLNSVEGVIFELANKIYASKNLSIKDKFKEIISTHFYSETDTLDFSEAEESAKIINQWCYEKTNGNIPNIVSENDLNESLALILLNAVYFKGRWAHVFDEEATISKPFHINKTTTVDVPTMHIKEEFFYRDLQELNAECIALPYENEAFLLVIIIPREIDGLKRIEENLEKYDLESEAEDWEECDIELALPRFKIETTIDLNSHLVEMGMVDMFDIKANFSGISDSTMYVDKVLQKAFIEVNEEGSEAAAVTDCLIYASLVLESHPVKLDVNRPFYYKIVHGNVTLFSGHVMNPLS